MDAPKGNLLCDLEGPRAGMLKGFGIGASLELMLTLRCGVALRAEGLRNKGLGVLNPPKRLSDLAASQ